MNVFLYVCVCVCVCAGLLSQLVQRDRVLFSLSHLCVVYSGQLPPCLFSAGTLSSIPFPLCSTIPFAIPFDKSRLLPIHDYKKVLRLFKLYFDLFQEPEVGNAVTVERNLSLYVNLLLFEASHGSHQKTINMLGKLTNLCPHLPDLWFTFARYVASSFLCKRRCFSEIPCIFAVH